MVPNGRVRLAGAVQEAVRPHRPLRCRQRRRVPLQERRPHPVGGVDSGAGKLTLPREKVIGTLKRDVLTIRAALAQSGTGLTS